MENKKIPDPNTIQPVAGYYKEIYIKPTITDPNIISGITARRDTLCTIERNRVTLAGKACLFACSEINI